MPFRLPVVLLGLVMLAGCESARPVHPPAGTVQHIVAFWLKEPGNAQQRQALIDATYDLGRLPGVVAVSAGTAVPSDRPVVDDTFDVALVMTFRDRAALDAYQVNPEHKAMTQRLFPLVQKVVVYDYQVH